MFGKQLQRCRLIHLEELKEVQDVLILGDGNGRFSTQLLLNHASARITSLDASKAFLAQARKRRLKAGLPEDRIQSYEQNILDWEFPAGRFDAVVAQFFFDSFDLDQLEAIAASISTCLRPKGKLLVSEFHIPKDTRMGNWRARVTLKFLYLLFGLLTGLKTRKLVTYTPILERGGFRLNKAIYRSQKTLVSQVFQKSE